MGYVIKAQLRTIVLLAAHENPSQDTDQSTRRWRNSRRDKAAVVVQLINEQYRPCCYSEIRFGLHGLGYHTEHAKNKGQHSGRTFDYQNPVASALDPGENSGLSSLEKKNAFGDHAQGKQDVIDIAKFTHHHIRDCSRYFTCLSGGRIVPADELNAQETEDAQYTIDPLNLNSGFPQTEHRSHWEELERLFDKHIKRG